MDNNLQKIIDRLSYAAINGLSRPSSETCQEAVDALKTMMIRIEKLERENGRLRESGLQYWVQMVTDRTRVSDTLNEVRDALPTDDEHGRAIAKTMIEAAGFVVSENQLEWGDGSIAPPKSATDDAAISEGG